MDNRCVKQIHIHQQVSRQLKALDRRNNFTTIVSARAKKIIETLVQGIPLSSSGHSKPKTDRRLKNSIKFDLGSGFRLICIRKKKAIHVMFLGDHDSCDTWLTHHGRKKPYKKGKDVFFLRSNPPMRTYMTDKNDNKCLEEETGLPEISQKNLKLVFKGLVG